MANNVPSKTTHRKAARAATRLYRAVSTIISAAKVAEQAQAELNHLVRLEKEATK
ncbi:MAG: hypothetical protein ACYC35_16275 [Pirellulales bacterium]